MADSTAIQKEEVNIFIVSSRKAEREAAALATALNSAGGKVTLNPCSGGKHEAILTS